MIRQKLLDINLGFPFLDIIFLPDQQVDGARKPLLRYANRERRVVGETCVKRDSPAQARTRAWPGFPLPKTARRPLHAQREGGDSGVVIFAIQIKRSDTVIRSAIDKLVGVGELR